MGTKIEPVNLINYTGSSADRSRSTSIDFNGFKNVDIDSLKGIVGLSEVTFNSVNSGLNDLTVSGYSNTNVSTSWSVEVVSNTYTIDYFDVLRDNTSIISNTAINSELSYNIGNGFSITFGSNTGHNEGDSWSFTSLTSFDVSHQLATIISSHDGTNDDNKGRLDFYTNQEIPTTSNITFTGSGTDDFSVDSNLHSTIITIDDRVYSVKIISQPDGVKSFTSCTSGTDHTSSEYTGINPTGGSGTGIELTLNISSGEISTVTITDPGTNYQINDVLTVSNTIIGGTTNATFTVEALSNDRFSWSLDNFSTTEDSNVEITGTSQYLSTTNDFILISFSSGTGHTYDDVWTFETGHIDPALTIFSNSFIVFPNTVISKTGVGYSGIKVYDINDTRLL